MIDYILTAIADGELYVLQDNLFHALLTTQRWRRLRRFHLERQLRVVAAAVAAYESRANQKGQGTP